MSPVCLDIVTASSERGLSSNPSLHGNEMRSARNASLNLLKAGAAGGRFTVFLLLLCCWPGSLYSFGQSVSPDVRLCLDRLTQLSTDHSSCGLDQSQIRAVQESLERAALRIESQITTAGPSAELYSELATVLYRNHQPGRSLDAFSTMLKFRQPNADEFRLIALDYVALHDLVSADTWLHASLKLRSTDWRTWRYLGGVQYSEEMVADAIGSFQECLKLDPHNALAEDGLARSLDALGNHDEAERAYRSAIVFNIEGHTPSWLPPLHYGTFLFKKGNLKEALEQLSIAERIDPMDSETHEVLSGVYRRMRLIEKAISEMRIASSLRPERARLHLILSQLYRDAGQRADGQKEIELYATLSKQYPKDPDR